MLQQAYRHFTSYSVSSPQTERHLNRKNNALHKIKSKQTEKKTHEKYFHSLWMKEKVICLRQRTSIILSIVELTSKFMQRVMHEFELNLLTSSQTKEKCKVPTVFLVVFVFNFGTLLLAFTRMPNPLRFYCTHHRLRTGSLYTYEFAWNKILNFLKT